MEYEKLSGNEKGEIARSKYLRENGIDSVEVDRTWVRQSNGKWLCISYSSEDKSQANYWSFAPAQWRVKEGLGDGTLEAVILLCETESGKIVDLRLVQPSSEPCFTLYPYTTDTCGLPCARGITGTST